jgi:hypothetical protein
MGDTEGDSRNVSQGPWRGLDCNEKRRDIMRVIIHETYEYEVEAETVEQAVEMWEEYMQDGEENEGVKFNQNYVHTYDTEGNEI